MMSHTEIRVFSLIGLMVCSALYGAGLGALGQGIENASTTSSVHGDSAKPRHGVALVYVRPSRLDLVVAQVHRTER